jgi:hypothetical protein
MPWILSPPAVRLRHSQGLRVWNKLMAQCFGDIASDELFLLRRTRSFAVFTGEYLDVLTGVFSTIFLTWRLDVVACLYLTLI